MYMPAFKAKQLVKGVSDETEVSDLQGTLAGRSRESASLTLTVQGVSFFFHVGTFRLPWRHKPSGIETDERLVSSMNINLQ